jgi:hypothetical protein
MIEGLVGLIAGMGLGIMIGAAIRQWKICRELKDYRIIPLKRKYQNDL